MPNSFLLRPKSISDKNRTSVPINIKSLLRILKHPRLKSFRFILVGSLLASNAYILNITLVEIFHMDKSFAYALVLASEMILGLLANRYLVFDRSVASLPRVTAKYFFASIVIRGTNWTLYTLLNTFVFEHREGYYLVSQSICILLFLLLKYFVFKKIFEFSNQ